MWKFAVFAAVLAAIVAITAGTVSITAGPPAYVVNTTADDPDGVLACDTGSGDCSLRAAIEQANDDGGGTITFDAGVFPAGAPATIIQAAAAPGVASHRVINIPFGREVSISGVTIRHGLVESSEPRHLLFPGTASGMVGIPLEFGGGIHIHGTLRLSYSVITGNQAGGGGGIFNGGILTLSNTIVESNTATASGGGIYNGGVLEMLNADLTDNRAGSGVGIATMGSRRVERGTLTCNRAETGGGVARQPPRGGGAGECAAGGGARRWGWASGPGAGGSGSRPWRVWTPRAGSTNAMDAG